MNKKKAEAVFIVLLTCGLITQAFAQSQEPKFNSNADDIRKIGNLLEEFRQDIIRKDGYALKKLVLYSNVLFHSIDDQESVDKARKLKRPVRWDWPERTRWICFTADLSPCVLPPTAKK